MKTFGASARTLSYFWDKARPAGLLATLALALVLGQTARGALVDIWDAADLSGTALDGDPVSAWTSMNGRVASQAEAAPTFKENATPKGTPALTFDGTSRLTIGAASSPVSGLTSFTLAFVFKVNTAPTANDNAQWWGQTGLVDAEQPGGTADWGTALRVDGTVGLGIGGPDNSLYTTEKVVAEPLYHVAVCTWNGTDAGSREMRVYLDGKPPVIVTGGTISTTPRNAAIISLGGIQTGQANRRFKGDLAEVRFYDTALIDADATDLVNTLIAKHGLVFPTLISSFTAEPKEIDQGEESTLSWQVAPNSTVIITPEPGNVGGITVDGMGSFDVLPENDTLYTITVTSNGIVRTAMAVVAVNQPPATALVDVWDASELALVNFDGDPVTTWPSAQGRTASHSAFDMPTFVEFATPAETSAVRFKNALMRIDGTENPVAGLSEFSVAYVFRVNGAPSANDNAQWWGKTGIVDSEQPGSTSDWGTVLDESGRFGFGVGGPDLTIYQPGPSVADGQFHVAISAWSQARSRIYLDFRALEESPAAASTSPRVNGAMAFGGIQTGQQNRLFDGDLVEVRFYNDRLGIAQALSVIEDLVEKHGLQVPFSMLPTSGFVAAGSLRITWESNPGATYGIWKRANLSDAEWMEIGEVTATGTISEYTDTNAAGEQGFYQVRIK